MPRKPNTYEGELKKFPDFRIYLNVEYLKKGKYELNIVNKNTLVKKTTFKKK